MKAPTAASVLEAIGISLSKAIAHLQDAAIRNPDAAPAIEGLIMLLNTAVTAEALAALPVQVPKEILDWITKPTTDVVGDDSDMA